MASSVSGLRAVVALIVVVPLLASCTAPSISGSGKEGYCSPQDNNAVTVIIDYGDLGPEPAIGCAYDLPEKATGLDALIALGIEIIYPTQSPHFICRINGYPTREQTIPIPGNDGYTEMCVNTPPTSAYWTYWTADKGKEWVYATRGHDTNPVIFGGSEGYRFSTTGIPAQSSPHIEPAS